MAKNRERTVINNESISVQEVRRCFLCSNNGISLYQGLRDRFIATPGIWELKRCTKCGLVWLNPRPLPEEIGKLYIEYYTHKISDSVASRAKQLRNIIEPRILASTFGYNDLIRNGFEKITGRIFSWVGPLREIVGGSIMWLKASQRGRLLDVGCGTGRFLANMRALGWEAIGVEPDPKAVGTARNKFGIDIFQGNLEEAEFPEDFFDAVTMNHAIEHMRDPISTLQECSRVLKRGGHLVVVTPNIKSFGHLLFGKAWLHLDPPRHLYLFSLSTLRTCADRAGFRDIKMWTTARSARFMWAPSHLIGRKGVLYDCSPYKQGLLMQLIGLVFQIAESELCRATAVGEEIVLIATK